MKKLALFVMTSAVLAACAKSDKTEVAADTTAMAPAAGAVAGNDSGAGAMTPGTSAVTDPQIAAIVVAANTADIEGGRQAATKSTNAKVKEFAQRMITDHGGVNKSAVALVTKLGVTPEESATSKQQTEGGAQVRQTLKGKSGVEFDRLYMANEVTYHQRLLDAIDKTLLPGAQNAELKALLEKTRPVVVDHLAHAQRLQGSLGS